MGFPAGFDERGMPNGTPPAARTVGSDGTTDTKAAERPSVPAPAKEHGHSPAPHSPGKRTNAVFRARRK
jgi:hypothetical protein